MAIDYAMEDLDMYLYSNVAQRIKMLREPEYEGETITLEEEKLLLEHAANSKARWLKASIILAIDTGMRRGEIIKLKYEDVNFSKRTCKLRDTKGGVDRSVGLSSRAVEAIKELPLNIDGRVIACRDGDQFMWFWKQCRKSSGVKKRFHSTRATFCTRSAEDGWQLLDIAAQSGHKDVNVLRKHYAKLKAEYLSRKIK
jgi:integrase